MLGVVTVRNFYVLSLMRVFAKASSLEEISLERRGRGRR
jgi:hypothetical protein